MTHRPASRRLRPIAVLTAVGLLLAACSNSSDGSKTSNTTAAPTTAAPETTAPSDTTGGSTVETTGGATTTIDTSTNNPSSEPGVTDTEIRFASFGTNSNNPLGTCVLDCYDDGIKAYFEWRNSENNGVWGRKLVLSKAVDDELTNNQARAKELIAANDTFGMFSATQIASGWADVAAAGIPLYTWSIMPAEMTGHPEIFGYNGVTCTDCTSRSAPYIAKVIGAKKVAALGYGVSANSKLCADNAAESIKAYSADIGGAEVAYLNDDLPFGLPNGIAPEVTAMKDAGVDYIISCLDLNAMKTIATELKKQGIRDKVVMYHPNTYNQDFVKAANGLFDNDYVAVGFRPFEADSAGSQLDAYHTYMEKTGKKETELAMIGWLNADLAYQGLVAAGPDFTRKSVIDATNTFTAWTGGGLVNPIDWSRQHEPPTQDDPATHGYKQECTAWVKIVSGAFEVVGDKAKPWLCWPGDNRDWSDPVATNFS